MGTKAATDVLLLLLPVHQRRVCVCLRLHRQRGHIGCYEISSWLGFLPSVPHRRRRHVTGSRGLSLGHSTVPEFGWRHPEADDQCDASPPHHVREGEHSRYPVHHRLDLLCSVHHLRARWVPTVQLQKCVNELDLGGLRHCFLGCLLLLVVHTNNDFITALPVNEGMMTSGISAADVRQALTCVPAIVCVNLGFNVPYNAMNNAYPAQACQMDTVVFGKQLNGAFFTLGDAEAIIIFVPIMEMLVYPALARCRGREATRTEKYTAGFTFCILANVVAVVIELQRRAMSVSDDPDFVLCPEHFINNTKHCTNSIPSNHTPSYWLSSCSPGSSLPMTNMSAFWSFSPMVLTGLGEILVNPVIYQYVFENTPASLRSILQALNLVVAGSISNAVTAALGPLIPEDFNEGHLVYYFYANIVIGALSLVAFWVIARVQAIPETEERTGVTSSLIASVNRGSALLGQAGGPAEGTGFGSQRRSLLGSTVNSQSL